MGMNGGNIGGKPVLPAQPQINPMAGVLMKPQIQPIMGQQPRPNNGRAVIPQGNPNMYRPTHTMQRQR